MTGAVVVLIINLIVAGLLSASFTMVAVYDPKQVAARWIACVYGLGAFYVLVEFGIANLGGSRLVVVGSFAAFLLALALFNVGIARKYLVPVPWRLMAAVLAVSIIACYLIQDMPRESFLRMMIYQVPYFVMQAIGAGTLWRARARGRLDTVLMCLLAMSSLQFLSKPFLSQALGGTGASPQTYLSTDYALVSQAMGTVFAIAIALLFLVILARDVIGDVRILSETDALSRLLNRGGFEDRATLLLRKADAGGRPMALVICDLDHFKAVNDTFGHASGDRVIRAFAGFLRDTASAGHVAGRIGGEEFAILLPGANLVTARLFAEATRTAFCGLPVAGLPPHLRFTASFGVAERMPRETLSDLLSRADKALYEAKRDGRDCVRVATDYSDGRYDARAS